LGFLICSIAVSDTFQNSADFLSMLFSLIHAVCITKSRAFERNFFYVLLRFFILAFMLKQSIPVCGLILSAVVCVAESKIPSKAEMVQGTLAAVQDGARTDRAEGLSAMMSQTLDATLRLRPDELDQLSTAADCIRWLRLTESVSLKPATERWLLADPARLHLLTASILLSDDLPRCFQWLEKLLEHDPPGREKYFKLMLALSVVWDQPKRPPLHRQMGKKTLSFRVVLTERYDYFKELYVSGAAKIPYRELDVRDLIFVVDTPVPLSELRWARENERGSAPEWGDKFSDIIYDTSRISAGDFQWPYGTYTLASIREKGGICVDQAYYAAITARAFGIPAVCFEAAGKSASHEWFAHMQKPGEWNLGVGRYEGEEYTTGWTINPQTNGDMTDHDIVYQSARAQNPDRAAQSDAYTAIALTLMNDPDNVRKCAGQARKIDPQNLKAWQVEMDALMAEEDCRELMHFFDELKDAFREHPDIVVEAAGKIGAVLKEAGHQDEVDQLFRQTARQVDSGRDDLVRFFGMDEIDAFVKEGNIKKARRKIEDLLEEHIEDGTKIFPVIRWYLEVTENTDQTKAAAKFMEEHIEEILDSLYLIPGYRKNTLGFLLKAYEQDGDEKGISETKARISEI
jgi:tetratricopeptide (TPR) repeat protein